MDTILRERQIEDVERESVDELKEEGWRITHEAVKKLHLDMSGQMSNFSYVLYSIAGCIALAFCRSVLNVVRRYLKKNKGKCGLCGEAVVETMDNVLGTVEASVGVTQPTARFNAMNESVSTAATGNSFASARENLV